MVASVLHSICSSGQLIRTPYMDRQHALTCWALWTGEVNESQDLASVEQYDLRIKALNKDETYLSSVISKNAKN